MITFNDREFYRANNDVNGNPRYILHWQAFARTYSEALRHSKGSRIQRNIVAKILAADLSPKAIHYRKRLISLKG
jgi:hypothetical protein